MIYDDVDLAGLYSVEAEFSEATALGVITVDRSGQPVTSACGFSAFCQEIRKDPIRRQMCYACDAYGGLQSAMEGKPRIYRCHAGLVDFSIPIVVRNNYLGAILCGQVRVQRNVDAPGYLISPTQTWQQNPRLAELYSELPQISITKIHSAANLLSTLAEEMTQTKLSRVISGTMPLPLARAHELAQRQLEVKPSAQPSVEPSAEPERDALFDAIENNSLPAAIEAISAELDRYETAHTVADEQVATIQQRLQAAAAELAPRATSALKYAIAQRRHRNVNRPNRYKAQVYLESLLHIIFDERGTEPHGRNEVQYLLNQLHRNPTKTWTLKEAAGILQVSFSYASKRFKAETGKSFISYVTNMRIDRAKLMLIHTTMPAQRIAKELHLPPNYFSRVFKSVTGVTPSEYRAKNT
ncbi:MAG: PocR ligand-binding domain-containing protein [Propionibacteriaceae bacterium]|jgi:ligand-binding sensor protein/AraC-like DNA-binding protein|nr:PocR ligand-binding domain-containing protein [Propionibacteriaceae bacterium]